MNTDFTKSIEELHREAIGEAPAELMTEGEYRELDERIEAEETAFLASLPPIDDGVTWSRTEDC